MDKSKLYGYDLPNGTWFVKMKIENDEMWDKIKEGELKRPKHRGLLYRQDGERCLKQ